MRRSLFALIVLLTWYRREIEALECSLPHEDKIRVFDSQQHYQDNKVPFSFSKGGWKGSTVEFSLGTIPKLSKNDFITADSQSIITLKLSGKKITEIDDGAFITLLCLHQLFLDHNNITNLTKGVFQDLSSLRKLDLSYNKIEILKDLTFADLPKLTSLNLGNNQIKTVEILAFTNLSSLEYLNLERNEIKKLDDELFRPLPNLSFLTLAWNRLVAVELKRLSDKLLTLDLAGNNFDHFYPSHDVSFPNLKSLNLSFNSLTVLNVRELQRHFPKLESIDLNRNRWSCDDLEGIVHELKDSRIKVSPGNTSRVGVQGVACDEVVEYSSTTSSTSSSGTSASTGRSRVWIDRDELERYVEKKIEDNNEELRSSMASIRSLAVFAFSLLCVYIVFEVLYRTNACGALYNRFRGGNELYVDDGTDIENFRLLHR